MLLTKKSGRFFSYVGYTNNLDKRIKLHNDSKGAKFTRGNKWKIIFKKKFISKIKALKYEYFLKKNRKLRLIYKNKAIQTQCI
tara:strand:- start:182 stop:430 length:249 start_codon:yes stop_codon:yes gene_type:complete